MFAHWLKNINANLDIVEKNTGTSLVVVVSKSEADMRYWKNHFWEFRQDVFRRDGKTHIVSVAEGTTKGNFLGMLNAWAHTKREAQENGFDIPDVGLMSMVFGMGTRLSPFTQSMGNRKPAFVTPMMAKTADRYFTAADISNLYTNTWIQHFRESGFRGLILKWGDEALIPGNIWKSEDVNYCDADSSFISHGGLYLDSPALISKINGIAHEVIKHLSNLPCIGIQFGNIFLNSQFYFQLFVPGHN